MDKDDSTATGRVDIGSTAAGAFSATTTSGAGAGDGTDEVTVGAAVDVAPPVFFLPLLFFFLAMMKERDALCIVSTVLARNSKGIKRWQLSQCCEWGRGDYS
jgi:hypothetical protein